MLEDWTKNYNEGIQTDIIYLDFKKTFDTVPVQRLIYKLEKLGVRGRLLTWIKDFLTDWSCCPVRGERSAWCSVGSGVPHLGVIVSSNLKSRDQGNQSIEKSNKMLGMIR